MSSIPSFSKALAGISARIATSTAVITGTPGAGKSFVLGSIAELEARAKAMKDSGYISDLELFGTDEKGLREILQASADGGVPNLMASMGFSHSIEDNGKVRDAWTKYLQARGRTSLWTSSCGRIYFTNDEDAVMARCLS